MSRYQTVIRVRLEPAMVRELARRAKRDRASASSVIRDAIAAYLEQTAPAGEGAKRG